MSSSVIGVLTTTGLSSGCVVCAPISPFLCSDCYDSVGESNISQFGENDSILTLRSAMHNDLCEIYCLETVIPLIFFTFIDLMLFMS